MSPFTRNSIPDQLGKRFVITGALGGLGYETALALAAKGAEIILAGRNAQRGASALASIGAATGNRSLRFEALDLASLASIADFSARMKAEGAAIDCLINNAGVMAVPARQVTADGFELQFGTNYLGHFALSAQLLPLLCRASAPRVVSLASLAHRRGAIDFNDLQSRNYSAWRAYQQSKLAMLMFALELQRRSDAAGWGLLSAAAHPGWAMTELFEKGPAAGGGRAWLPSVARVFVPLLGQSAAAGALPTLYAAVSPEALPGGYYGPDGLYELRGAPAPSFVSAAARDAGAAARLWAVSLELTGAKFDMA